MGTNNLDTLKIINKLSNPESVAKVQSILQNYTQYNKEVLSILINSNVENFIKMFVGYTDTLVELHNLVQPKEQISMQDLNSVLKAQPEEEIEEYEEETSDDEYETSSDEETTSEEDEYESAEEETPEPAPEPTMTQEQAKKTFQLSDEELKDLSKSNKINGLSESAEDELGEIIDTSHLPKVIPDVEELVQAISTRNKAVFESCLQLDRPYGMLYDKGMLSYAVVDGKVMYRGGENRGGKSLFEKLYQAIINGTDGNINCAKDLRNVPNYQNLEESNVTYYPGFMFKYALGIVDGKPYKAWGKFEKALRDSLRDKLRRLYTKDDLFFKNFEKIEAAFSTSILILSYEAGTGIKLRLSLPGTKIDATKLEKSIREIATFRNAAITILNMAGNEDVVDIQVLQDESKYLNRPYWAYQAMKVKLNNGESISLSGGLPIGRKANGEIVDFKLDPSARFMNFLAAGSGSGKGVMTLSILAAALGSGIPVMYIDFKPDMAEIFWKAESDFGIRTFTYDAMGVNRRGTQYERNFADSIPEYAKADFESFASVLFYMKAVQLMCAIAQRRADVGFDGQIMFIFDETQALQMQVSPLANKCNEIKKKYKKEPNNPLYQYACLVGDWLINVDGNLSKYINTTGRKSSTFTVFIAQSADYTLWTEMKGSIDGGGKLSLLSQVCFGGTVFKMLGKGTTTSKYGLGGGAVPEKELQYVANNRFFGMYDGKTTDGANITIFKPFLTLNYDDPFEKCWYEGLGKSFGAGTDSDEKYIENILAEHPGEEGYSNKYNIHTGTGLLGLTSMYCQGDLEKVKTSLGKGLEYVNKFLEETGLNAKYANADDYMFDLSFDGLMLVDNMLHYEPSKENSVQRNVEGQSSSSSEDDTCNNGSNEEMYAFNIDADADIETEPDSSTEEFETQEEQQDEQDTPINDFSAESILGDEFTPNTTGFETDAEFEQAFGFDDDDFDDNDNEPIDFGFEPEDIGDSLVGDNELLEPVEELAQEPVQEPIPEPAIEPIPEQEEQEVTQEPVIQAGNYGISIINNKVQFIDGNLVSVSLTDNNTCIELEPTDEIFVLANMLKLYPLFDIDVKSNTPNQCNVESKCRLSHSGQGEWDILGKGKISLIDNSGKVEKPKEVEWFNPLDISEPMPKHNAEEEIAVEQEFEIPIEEDTEQNSLTDIEEPIDDYEPELIERSVIDGIESSLIESVDPNAEDYLGAVTRMLLHQYKTGKIDKQTAENVALNMNLRDNGYLKSYNMDTPDNYIGSMPSKIPVELVEKGTVATKKVNKTITIDESVIDENNKVILKPTSVIKCQDINKGVAKIFKDCMQESPEAILDSADSMWKQLLLNCKRYEKNITSVELTNGQMRINKKLLNLNGIIDNDNLNRDSITLASIINYKLMFKYFNELETLLIDEQMVEMGYIEFGRGVLLEMFKQCKTLKTIILQQNDGRLRKVSKQEEDVTKNWNVEKAIQGQADKINMRIQCLAKRKKNFTNQSFSDRVMNTKMATGKNDNADKLQIEKTTGIKSLIGKLGKKLVDLGGDNK